MKNVYRISRVENGLNVNSRLVEKEKKLSNK